jgi:hypothetical protein
MHNKTEVHMLNVVEGRFKREGGAADRQLTNGLIFWE